MRDNDEQVRISEPEQTAAGLEAVKTATKVVFGKMGVVRGTRAMLKSQSWLANELVREEPRKVEGSRPDFLVRRGNHTSREVEAVGRCRTVV